jgi:hypothetical protein
MAEPVEVVRELYAAVAAVEDHARRRDAVRSAARRAEVAA